MTSWKAVSMGPAILAGSNLSILARIGIPDPLTQAIIMEIQVPMNKTVPKTKGCSGSLQWNNHFKNLKSVISLYVSIISALSASV